MSSWYASVEEESPMKSPVKTVAKKVAGVTLPKPLPPLVLKKETVLDLARLLNEARGGRQSRKVCVA